MTSELSFTSNQILAIVIGIFILIIGVILIGRYFINKQADSGLTKKYVGKKFSSPLVGRNKYPDVDVFQYRTQFLLLGLALTMALMISAFGFTSYENEIIIPDNALEYEEDIEIEPPRSAEPPPPPPPPPPVVISEIPADVMEEEDVEFVDQSVEESTEIEEVVPEPVEKAAPPPPPPPPPPPEPDVAEIFQIVEDMPRFPGCEQISDKKEKYACSSKKMLEFIYSNIKYPSVAKENNIQGTVVIRFVVNEKGKLDDVEVIRDIGGACGDEALRIINLMNQQLTWFPGKQRGKPVKVRMNLPIKFKLIS